MSLCGPVLEDFENCRKVPYRGLGSALENFDFQEKFPMGVCVLERLVFYEKSLWGCVLERLFFYEKIPMGVCVLERLVFYEKKPMGVWGSDLLFSSEKKRWKSGIQY